MPHIELKTTANIARALDVPAMLQQLVDKLSTFETVKTQAIKAYHLPISDWVMGSGAPKGFVHCTISVLTGRPMELRQRMATEMVAVIREALLPEIRAGEVSVTLELREMESETYQK